MKTNRLISIAAVAIFALIGTVGKSQTTATTSGNDSPQVQTLTLDAFDEIDNSTAVEIHFTQGKKQSVKVRQTGEWRLLATVKDRTLRLTSDKNNTHNSAEIWITAPELKSLDNNSSLKIDMLSLHGSELEIDNCGVMTVRCNDLNTTNLSIENSGNLKYELKAKAGIVEIENEGVIHELLTMECSNLTLENEGLYQSDMSVTGKTLKIDNSGKFTGKMLLKADRLSIDNNGAGSQSIDFAGKELKLDNNGAVTVDLKVDCRKLDVSNQGVSTITISGTADSTTLDSSGINKIDSSKLNRL